MVNAMSNYVASASSYTYMRYTEPTEPILQLSAVTRVSCDVVSDYRCVCRALSMFLQMRSDVDHIGHVVSALVGSSEAQPEF